MLFIFLGLYFLSTFFIGYIASKKVSNAADYINTGRNLHPALNAAALFALWFGSETIFGASSKFSKYGIKGIIEDPLGGVLCLLLVGFVFSKRMYNLNMYTIGDLLRLQYGKRVELLGSFMMVLNFIGYAAAQLVAMGLILSTLTGWSIEISIIIGFLVVIGYTYGGGMWAVSLTDFIQSIIIIIGLVIISFFVTEQVGSVSEVWSSVPNSHKEWIPESGFVSWVNWIAAWMVLGLGSTVSQDIFQRVNSARSVDAAYFSSIIGAILYLIFATLPLYLIIACKLLDPTLLEGDLQLSLPRMVLSKMPIWIQVLFFGSIFSAIMSTCSGALLAPASLLSENMIKPLLKDNMDNKDLLKYTRLALIIIGFISMIIAFRHQDIFELVSISSIFGLVSIFVPYIAALFFGQTNSRSAIMSMLAGTTTWLLFSYYFTTAVNPLIHGLIASVVGWYIPFLLWEERKPSVIV